jgi:hypothetical protein
MYCERVAVEEWRGGGGLCLSAGRRNGRPLRSYEREMWVRAITSVIHAAPERQDEPLDISWAAPPTSQVRAFSQRQMPPPPPPPLSIADVSVAVVTHDIVTAAATSTGAAAGGSCRRRRRGHSGATTRRATGACPELRPTGGPRYDTRARAWERSHACAVPHTGRVLVCAAALSVTHCTCPRSGGRGSRGRGGAWQRRAGSTAGAHTACTRRRDRCGPAVARARGAGEAASPAPPGSQRGGAEDTDGVCCPASPVPAPTLLAASQRVCKVCKACAVSRARARL